MNMFAQKKMKFVVAGCVFALLAAVGCSDYANEYKEEYEELMANGGWLNLDGSSSSAVEESSSSIAEEKDSDSSSSEGPIAKPLWHGNIAKIEGLTLNVKKSGLRALFPRALNTAIDTSASYYAKTLDSLIYDCRGVCGKVVAGKSKGMEIEVSIDSSVKAYEWKGLCIGFAGKNVGVKAGTASVLVEGEDDEITYKDFSWEQLNLDPKSLKTGINFTLFKDSAGGFDIKTLGEYGSCENESVAKNKLADSLFVYPVGKAAWRYLNTEISYGEFRDARDNQLYKTIEIDGKKWIAENLNYNVSNETKICGGVRGYEGVGCELYGQLYSYLDRENVCPEGWSLPDSATWVNLVEFAGGGNLAVINLLSQLENVNGAFGSNKYGFSASVVGVINKSGSFNNKYGDYWRGDANAYVGFGKNPTVYFSSVYANESGDESRNSVRCVWNADQPISSSSVVPVSSSSVAVDPIFYEYTDARDNKVYQIVVLGGMHWFAENLAYEPLDEKTYCGYADDGCEKYGRLYGADDVKNGVNFCPEGWHIPSGNDWKSLSSFVDLNADLISEEENGNNKTGFSMMFAGRVSAGTRYNNGKNAEFLDKEGDFHVFNLESYGKKSGSYYYSIRCLKDDCDDKPCDIPSTKTSEPTLLPKEELKCDSSYKSWCLLNPNYEYGSFEDTRVSPVRVYKTMKIGKLEWFAENLSYVPSELTTYCGYRKNGCDIYGVLFDSYDVVNTQLCPAGWRIPTRDEMESLQLVLGTDYSNWISGFNGGSNTSGFSVVLAGSNSDGAYNRQGTSGEIFASDGTVYRFEKDSYKIIQYNKAKNNSVRCVRDLPESEWFYWNGTMGIDVDTKDTATHPWYVYSYEEGTKFCDPNDLVYDESATMTWDVEKCNGFCGELVPGNSFAGSTLKVDVSISPITIKEEWEGICFSYLSTVDNTSLTVSSVGGDFDGVQYDLEATSNVKTINLKWNDLPQTTFKGSAIADFLKKANTIGFNLVDDDMQNAKFDILEIGSYGSCTGKVAKPAWFDNN